MLLMHVLATLLLEFQALALVFWMPHRLCFQAILCPHIQTHQPLILDPITLGLPVATILLVLLILFRQVLSFHGLGDGYIFR